MCRPTSSAARIDATPVITNATQMRQWKLKKTYQLDPILFKQPEGLAFDSKGNMYISNEGHGGNANVLLFNYKP